MATLFIGSSIACTCAYIGVFEEFAKQHPIIVRGTIREHGVSLRNRPGYFETMTVAVSETLKGSFPHSAVEFFGDTGMACLRYITQEDYPLGSEHLFILASGESIQPLMVCGESSVRIVGNRVQGRALDAEGYHTYEAEWDEFLEQLN